MLSFERSFPAEAVANRASDRYCESPGEHLMARMLGRFGTVVASMAAAATFAIAGDAPPELVERGRYLVEQVAECGFCHTPRDADGRFLSGQALFGGPLFIRPANPVAGWSDATPPLAGLPGWDRADAVKFLETGETPNGIPPRTPMHAYRLSHADATAIVAYLKTLTPPALAAPKQ